MGAKTMINVKIDVRRKKKAQQLARDLGLSLGAVVNRYLDIFLTEGRIVFEKPEIPNAETRKALREARAALKTGKNISPGFTNAADAIAWLNR